MNRSGLAILGLIFVLASWGQAEACTVFFYAGGGTLLFGNSEDYDRLMPLSFATLTTRESCALSKQLRAANLKKVGGARVITNFNVTDPTVGTHPCWRYDTVDGLRQRFESGLSTPSIPLFRTLLDGVHIPGYTAYSNLFDVAAMTAYVYRAGRFRDVRVIDLYAIFADGAPGAMTLDAFFEVFP